MRLSALEKGHITEDAQWLNTDDDAAWGEFDEKRFLAELRVKGERVVKAARPKRAAA